MFCSVSGDQNAPLTCAKVLLHTWPRDVAQVLSNPFGTKLALRRKPIGKGNGKGVNAPVPLRTYSVRSKSLVERPTYHGGVDRDPPTSPPPLSPPHIGGRGGATPLSEAAYHGSQLAPQSPRARCHSPAISARDTTHSMSEQNSAFRRNATPTRSLVAAVGGNQAGLLCSRAGGDWLTGLPAPLAAEGCQPSLLGREQLVS